ERISGKLLFRPGGKRWPTLRRKAPENVRRPDEVRGSKDEVLRVAKSRFGRFGGGAVAGGGGSFRLASPSFPRTAQEAGDVVFLEEHVEEDARDHGDGDPGLQQTPVRPADRGLLPRSGEHKRQGEGHAAIHDHEGGK